MDLPWFQFCKSTDSAAYTQHTQLPLGSARKSPIYWILWVLVWAHSAFLVLMFSKVSDCPASWGIYNGVLIAYTHTHISDYDIADGVYNCNCDLYKLFILQLFSNPKTSWVIWAQVRNSYGTCLRVSFAFPSLCGAFSPEVYEIPSLYPDTTDQPYNGWSAGYLRAGIL